jgi:rod shape-determining protein MreD
MTAARASRLQLLLVLGVLVLLHFYVRPRLWGARASPDFLLIAVMLFAMRSGPGAAAVFGFAIGLVGDALTPARFGAGALAHTVVGFLASWGRSLFFADNLLVNAGFVAAGLWLRDLVLLWRRHRPGRCWSAHPLSAQALPRRWRRSSCSRVREWFAIRLDMNGFDSIGCAGGGRSPPDLIATFLVLGGAFFRTQIISTKFQLRAETNRLRPIRSPLPGHHSRPRRDHRRERPGLLGEVLAPSVDSLRALLVPVGRFVPLDTARSDEVPVPTARYQPRSSSATRRRDHRRLEEHRAVLPGW